MTKISFSKFHSILFESDIALLSEAIGFDIMPEPIDKFKELKKQYLSEDKYVSSICLNEGINKKIDKAFFAANLKYKYFPDTDNAPDFFKELCLVFASLDTLSSDGNLYISPQLDGIYELVVLFDGESPEGFYKKLDRFFSKNFASYKDFTSFLKDLKIAPCKDYAEVSYDLPKARNLLNSKKDGIMVAKNFHMMPSFKKIPNDSSAFKEELFKIKYPEAKEDLALAKICDMFGVENFDSIIAGRKLGLVPTSPKEGSSLPDMHLQFHSKSSSYHLVKLPEENPRVQQLGNYVGNCMSWPSKNGGDDVNSVVFDAMHKENMGIYAIIKSSKGKPFSPEHIDNLEDYGHEFVGVSPVWVGFDKSINLGVLAVRSARTKNLSVMDIMKKFGEAAEEEGFDRVLVGGLSEINGIQDLKQLEDMHTEWNSIPAEGYKYAHILYQQEAHISERLANAREDLKKLTGFDDQSHITSVFQAEAVRDAIKKLQAVLDQETYVRYSNCYIMRNWDAERLIELVQEFEVMKNLNPELYSKLFDFQNDMKFNPGTRTTEYLTYKYGITIEDIYKLPKELIDVILGDELVKDSIVRLSNMQSFSELLQDVDSIFSLKRSLIKGYAKDLSKDDGDLSYIDDMSGSKLDRILKAPELVIFGFTNIRELDALSDDVFEYVMNHLSSSHGDYYLTGILPKMSDLPSEDLYSLKKALLFTFIKYKSSQDKKFNSFGDVFNEDLIEDNLLVCASNFGFKTILKSDYLSEIVKDPKESALNIQRRIIEKGYLYFNEYGIDRSVIELIRSMDEDHCNLILSTDSKVAINLFEHNLAHLYSQGKLMHDDLEYLDHQMFSSLLHFRVILDVLDRPVQFIRCFTSKKLKLVSKNSYLPKLHKEGKLDIMKLRDCEDSKIKALNSWGIMDLVESGKVTFDALLEFSTEQLEFMSTFPGLANAIIDGRLQFENLNECSPEQLDALDRAISGDPQNKLDLDHLRCQSPDIINAISEAKFFVEDSGFALWQIELARHSPEKIKYMFSYEESKCTVHYFCETSGIEVLDFIELPLDKIQILLNGYSNGSRVKFAGMDIGALRDMEVDKLQLLLSEGVNEYITSHYPTQLSDLVGMDVGEIQNMIHQEESPDVGVMG